MEQPVTKIRSLSYYLLLNRYEVNKEKLEKVKAQQNHGEPNLVRASRQSLSKVILLALL